MELRRFLSHSKKIFEKISKKLGTKAEYIFLIFKNIFFEIRKFLSKLLFRTLFIAFQGNLLKFRKFGF